jgi:hypothetical protein
MISVASYQPINSVQPDTAVICFDLFIVEQWATPVSWIWALLLVLHRCAQLLCWRSRISKITRTADNKLKKQGRAGMLVQLFQLIGSNVPFIFHQTTKLN